MMIGLFFSASHRLVQRIKVRVSMDLGKKKFCLDRIFFCLDRIFFCLGRIFFCLDEMRNGSRREGRGEEGRVPIDIGRGEKG